MNKLISFCLLLMALYGMLSSCEPAIEENIGSPFVLMSRDNMAITMTDNVNIVGKDTLFSSLRDTVIESIGVYRSGLSSEYPEINLKVKIDSIMLKLMIQQANDPLVPDVQKSSTVMTYKGAMMLPSTCYKFGPEVKIGRDQRIGTVSLTLYKSKFAKIKNTKIFLPIAIDTLSTSGVNTARAISIIQIKNAFVFKK
jgi:hypothetical protein